MNIKPLQRTRASFVTSAFLLMNALIWVQASNINEPNPPLMPDQEGHHLQTQPPVAFSLPTCFVAYTECGHNELCWGTWEMKQECHPDYKNVEIISKCFNSNETNFINDTALFAPMTSTETNITYLNVYCGLCNLEKQLLFKFDFWIPRLFCQSEFESHLNTINGSLTRSANTTGVLDGVEVIDDGDPRLISIVEGISEKCRVVRVVPKHLQSRVSLCFVSPQGIVRMRSVVRTVHQTFSRLVRGNVSEPFCSLRNNVTSMEWYCDYVDEYDDTCTVNEFHPNNTHLLCNSEGYFQVEISQDEKVQAMCSNHTSKKDHFYVCGPSKPNLYKKIKKTILNVTDQVSTFLLFLYLLISASKKTLRTLPKRIFYSYSVSLFILYTFEYPLKYVDSCVMKYYAFFYTWQAHSVWILITSFDLWRLVYNSLKIQKVNVEGQNTRFAIYCLIGWGLPALLLVALYPTLTSDQKSWTCPSVSGFQNELTCTSSCDLNKYTSNFGWVAMAMFLIVAPCLLVLTCVFVCRSTRNQARSTANRAYSILLMKVAVMMGVNWMLLCYVTLFDSGDKFSLAYEFVSSFHGCFIFFAFGLEKGNLNRFKRIVSRTDQTQVMSVSQSYRETELKSPAREEQVELEN